MDSIKKLNKKNIIITLLTIVIALLSTTGIVAYITRSTIAKNVITFGSLKMQLLQTTLDDNNEEVEVATGENMDITYSPNISRIVKIKNIGKHDFFARISIQIVGTDKNNNEFNANEYVTYNINTDDWIYEDGWYYYKKIVKKEELTSNLTIGLEFDINRITTNFPNGKFKFDIKSEALQAENNAENVLEAVGWPSNN